MANENDLFAANILRQARPASAGNVLAGGGAPGVSLGSTHSTTIIDGSGRVRRLWTPGDAWSLDYYFGSGLQVTEDRG